MGGSLLFNSRTGITTARLFQCPERLRSISIVDAHGQRHVPGDQVDHIPDRVYDLWMPLTSKQKKKHRNHMRKCYADPAFMRVQRERVKASRKRRIQKNKLVVDAARRSGCAACPEVDLSCLVFHHLDPKQKDRNISEMVSRLSTERVVAEIAKCIVLCANCHMKHHAGKLDVGHLARKPQEVL